MILDDRDVQIDDLLDKMAEEIQLDKTRYDRMVQSYEAVKIWIESDEKFFKPYLYEVYPHGSVRIKTTVKPLDKDEFDLDIAIHLKADFRNHTPQRIYEELKRRLEETERYKRILIPKNRCLRLDYAGDFHMDIMPGIQQSQWDENTIVVPDKKRGSWVISNPRGYAEWFKKKTDTVKTPLLEKAMQAERIPADNFKDKKPLQRAVQLIKRYRDMYFQKDDTYKTSSIILTTIAGEYYEGESSIFNTIDGIITRIVNNIQLLNDRRIKIYNPVNEQEDFTDKWDDKPQYYEEFKKFVRYLYQEWQELKKKQGIPEENVIMEKLFGREILNKAQVKQAEKINQLREQNKLGISRKTGNLTYSSILGTTTVKTNTFFGN
ncbi:MAG: nucleotidyltransferase [Cyclobacteriaceae bacterium]